LTQDIAVRGYATLTRGAWGVVVGCCWVLLGAVGCCWVLLGAVGCCWVLLRAVEGVQVWLSAGRGFD